jgi:hypothetical protein
MYLAPRQNYNYGYNDDGYVFPGGAALVSALVVIPVIWSFPAPFATDVIHDL